MQITDDVMQSVVAKAILDNLGEEGRASLIQGAVKSLLEKPTANSGYGQDRRTNIQRMFDNAAETVAQKIIREQLEADAKFEAEVKRLWTDVSAAIFADGDAREAMIEAMAKGYRKAMESSRY